MIEITIPKVEAFDSEKEQFIYPVKKPITLKLEHSLISIQKWESKWHKPFLSKEKKTIEETIDYIRCMCLTPSVDSLVYHYIPKSEINRVEAYIKNPMTATWFGDSKTPGGTPLRKDIITAEIIYYWMIQLNIPSEYSKWHINQLLTLIRVINVKNAPVKKRGMKETLADYARLNAMRRSRMNSKG